MYTFWSGKYPYEIHAQMIPLCNHKNFWQSIEGQERDDIAQTLQNHWLKSHDFGGLRLWLREPLRKQSIEDEDDEE